MVWEYDGESRLKTYGKNGRKYILEIFSNEVQLFENHAFQEEEYFIAEYPSVESAKKAVEKFEMT